LINTWVTASRPSSDFPLTRTKQQPCTRPRRHTAVARGLQQRPVLLVHPACALRTQRCAPPQSLATRWATKRRAAMRETQTTRLLRQEWFRQTPATFHTGVCPNWCITASLSDRLRSTCCGVCQLTPSCDLFSSRVCVCTEERAHRRSRRTAYT